jgi:hypothetical protein
VACPPSLTRVPRRAQHNSVNQVLECLDLGDKFVKGSLSAWSCACPAAMPHAAEEWGAARRIAPGAACCFSAARLARAKQHLGCESNSRVANSRAPLAG